jgi:hypothetical protein
VGSNLAAFVLRPRIEATNVTDVGGSGSELRSANIEVTVDPPVGVNQRVRLFLNELPPPLASPSVPAPPLLAYTFEGPAMALVSPPAPAALVTIPITEVAAGTYLVRIQVDGAESPLAVDAEGVYNSPQLTIP